MEEGDIEPVVGNVFVDGDGIASANEIELAEAAALTWVDVEMSC